MKVLAGEGLERKFQKVMQTPAGYDFFVAIHDFVGHIEADPVLTGGISGRIKMNRELNIPAKYENLKRIYQGLEDAHNTSSADLGHARYAVLIELNRIKKNETSESNSFWKKRELFRKLAGEIYERLSPVSV